MSAGTAIPALVFGSGLTPLGVIRILGHAGIPTFVAAGQRDFERHSRWFVPAPPSTGVDPGQDLAAYLDGLPLERAVLVPCSDQMVQATAALPGSYGGRFPASISPTGVLDRLVDKGLFAEALGAAGVPHPRTVIVKSADDLAALPDEAFAAGFLKPRDSQSFFAHFGVKAFRVRSRAEALAHFSEIAEARLQVVLQEYVPGGGDQHYLIDGYRDRQGAIRAWFARRRLRMYPLDFGNSTAQVSIPVEEVASAREALERLLAHLGYRGIFSAEFKRDERDGVYRLLEVNTRPWWYVEFAARCGVDVCTLAYRDALGLPLEDLMTYDVGRELVYPYYDYFACRELLRRGRLSLVEWGRSWSRAMQPVFRWDDPFPAWEGTLAIGLGWLRNRSRRPRGD